MELTETPSVNKARSEDLAMAITSRWGRLDEDASYWMSVWQMISYYVMPRKSYILNRQLMPNFDRETMLFDSTAVRANQTLAAGCMSYITPADARWCSFEPPKTFEDAPGVAEYFGKVTEIVLEMLARSNFHTAIHECYLDRGCFGTAALFVEPGESSPLVFKTFDVGTFRCAENFEGYVDTVFRMFEMTVRQVVQQFSVENVSDKVREWYEQPDGKGYDKKIEVIHAIYPREERDRNKRDGKNKAFASVYVEHQNKHTLRESGYDELPVFITRYLKWQQGAYGWSPSWVALPDIRQLNFIQKNMDALAELCAMPRVLVPDTMKNSVDMRAGGVTLFNAADVNAVPREWATVGRYDIGMDRVKEKQRHIEEAFSVPLFQLFTQAENSAPNRMTATEVNARNAERLAQFSPTFSRLTTELLTPLLQRVYGILARNGAFPPPPQSLIQQDPAGETFIPEPKITFNSRIALAVKAMEMTAAQEVLQQCAGLVQITQDKSIMDNFDLDKMARDGAISSGIDTDLLRAPQDMDKMRQQRQQAVQQAQQMQAQAHLADVAQKAGSIMPDSVLGQNLSKAQQSPPPPPVA